ncbi:hypothetical protein [Pseudonocardia lacus]|nr:hypothetical protein [Pseudonocardia lacus]
MTAVGIIVLVLIVAVGLLIGYGWVTDRGVHPSPAVGAPEGASDDKG